VIVATLNERANIDHVLDVALGTAAVIEVIVADGGSEDGTVERLRERQITDTRLVVIENPDRHQSLGLNRAAAVATGDLLVRLDGHTRYADDYVTASIRGWKPGVAVGGPMLAEGANRWEVATANAMSDPLAIGPGRFHHATTVEQVDTVYLGTFDRHDFVAVGGYRRFPSGTVEDTDFYERWQANGFRVFVDPAIRSWYRPRGSWREMAVQYWRYGRGKAELLRLNKRLPSLRPLAPSLLVAGLTFGTIIGVLWTWIPLIALSIAWFCVLVAVAARAPSHRIVTSIAAGTMHVSYGIGAWVGLVSAPPRIQSTGWESADQL
jgi:glycosyltransferase involved in cell wall biosynthesis